MNSDPSSIIRETLKEYGPIWGPIVLFSVSWLGWTWKRFQKAGEQPRLLRVDWVYWFISALLLCVALTAFIYLNWFWGIPPGFKPDEIGILIPEIPGDTDHQMQNSYALAIRSEAMSDNSLSAILKVQLLQRLLSNDAEEQQRQAVKWGERLNATFVIRPVPVKDGHSIWLTVVNLPIFPRGESHLTTISQNEISQLQDIRLPKDMTYLAKCAVALSHFRQGHFEQAAMLLSKILDSPGGHFAGTEGPYLYYYLGSAYLIISPSDPATLSVKAVEAYENSLKGLSVDSDALAWASALHNLAYAKLLGPRKGTAEQAAEVIHAFNQVIDYFRRENWRVPWAMAMENLGRAYLQAGGPDQSASVERAKYCFRQALIVYTFEKYPDDWAGVVDNLGIAYLQSLGPDHQANLQEAVRFFKESLRVRTRERLPVHWALTTNNLSAAFAQLEQPNNQQNAQIALSLLESSLQVIKRENRPEEWASIMANRGVAYRRQFQPPQLENLNASIESFQAALQVYTFERYPIEWARIMYSLGLTFKERDWGNLKRGTRDAVWAFENALKVFNKRDSPIEWARAMYNRGSSLHLWFLSPDRKRILNEAIQCYKDAIPILEAYGFSDLAAEARTNIRNAQDELAGKVQKTLKPIAPRSARNRSICAEAFVS